MYSLGNGIISFLDLKADFDLVSKSSSITLLSLDITQVLAMCAHFPKEFFWGEFVRLFKVKFIRNENVPDPMCMLALEAVLFTELLLRRCYP